MTNGIQTSLLSSSSLFAALLCAACFHDDFNTVKALQEQFRFKKNYCFLWNIAVFIINDLCVHIFFYLYALINFNQLIKVTAPIPLQ